MCTTANSNTVKRSTDKKNVTGFFSEMHLELLSYSISHIYFIIFL